MDTGIKATFKTAPTRQHHQLCELLQCNHPVATSRMEREESKVMTAVEETGGDVSLGELVTGVTTSRCCRWVSLHNTH